MGCKCTSDLFFGESEIIKANSIQQTKSNKTTYEKPLSNSSKYISQKNNYSDIKPPEINIIQKPNEETASILNSNKEFRFYKMELFNNDKKEIIRTKYFDENSPCFFINIGKVSANANEILNEDEKNQDK